MYWNIRADKRYWRRVLFVMALLSAVIGFSASGASGEDEGIEAVITPGTQPELLHDGKTQKPRLTFTEGPSWMNGRLYFSNYYMFWKPFGSVAEGGLMVMEPDGSFRILNTDMQTCGTVPLGNGNLAACDLIAARIVEISPQGEMVRVLADTYDGTPLDGPNDLVIDAKGGIYFTEPRSSGKKEKSLPGTAVFYRNPHGKLIRVTDWNEYEFPNGCALSPDGKRFHLICSVSPYVWAYDVREDGTLANRRKFAELSPTRDEKKGRLSHADGMTVDTRGRIYVATPAGIQVFDSSGTSVGIIAFPVSPSNCVFGGADMMTLFATCRDRIYSIRTNVAGIAYPPR